MWDNYKLPVIINYCRHIQTINNPYRYNSSIRYKTIYTKARKNRDIYAKSYYMDNGFQRAHHNPHLSLIKYKTIYTKAENYRRSPVYNIIDKCDRVQDADEIGF